MELLDPSTLLRLLALYAHVLACFGAAAAIVLGDVAIFVPRRVDAVLLSKASHWVTIALLLLWLSGLLLVGIDTGFEPAVIARKPKLLAKLTVVLVLSLNGLALHRWVFPRLAAVHTQPERAACLPSLLGGLGAASWLFAAFLGIAKPLAPVLGYAGFMLMYAGALLLAMGIALTLLRPRLSSQLQRVEEPLCHGLLLRTEPV